MNKRAPVWGKAIGIIMICLGGLGVFYQAYKIIVPSLFRNMFGIINNDAIYNHSDNVSRQAVNQLTEMMFMTEGQATAMKVIGFLGVLLTIFYIIGGAKLLVPKPANYKFARLVLGIFIFYNLVSIILVYTSNMGYFFNMIMIYAIVGLAFDVALFVILLKSNQADYGIGEYVNDTVVDLNSDNTYDEII